MHTGTGTYLQIFPPLFYTKYLYYSLVDFDSNSGVPGLARAIESKYNVSATAIRYLYRRNRKGITAKLDDDLLKYYCNEDTFLMQVCYGTYIGTSKMTNQGGRASGYWPVIILL